MNQINLRTSNRHNKLRSTQTSDMSVHEIMYIDEVGVVCVHTRAARGRFNVPVANYASSLFHLNTDTILLSLQQCLIIKEKNIQLLLYTFLMIID